LKSPLDQHIVSAYDKDLEALGESFRDMGELISEMVDLARKALAKKNGALTEKAEKKYLEVVALEKQVQQQAVKMLALRHPVANDLLFVTASIKVAAMLERMAELSKKISRKLGKLEKEPPKKTKKRLEEMADLVDKMTQGSVNAFGRGDSEKAGKVMEWEDKLDLIRGELFKELEQDMMANPSTIPSCMHALAITRNFERMGDHAVSVAQVVEEMVGVPAPQ
jgi:phosphate transport system protein